MLLIPNSMARFFGYTTVGLISTGTLQFLAIVFYIIFYKLYIPSDASRIMDVHLDYNLRHFYSTKSTWRTHVDGGAMAVLNLQEPKTSSQLDETFTVSLQLEFPRDEHNRHIQNNIMLYVLFTNDEQTIESSLPSQTNPKIRVEEMNQELSVRPLYIPFFPDLLDTLDTFVFLPLYLLRWKSKAVTVSTELADLPSNMYRFAMVELASDPTISSVKMIWAPKWSGLRYVMTHYRIISFVVGVTMFWFISAISAIIVAGLVTASFQNGNNSATSSNTTVGERKPEVHYRPKNYVPTESFRKATANISEKNSKEDISTSASDIIDDPLKILGPDPVDSFSIPSDLTPEPSPLPLTEEEDEDEEQNDGLVNGSSSNSDGTPDIMDTAGTTTTAHTTAPTAVQSEKPIKQD